MSRLAAVLGVLIISFSAIFVRLAGVAPDTSAFFRAAYALPALFLLWRLFDRRHRSLRLRLLAFASGIFLGLDLAFWHRAIEWIGAGLATVLGNTQVVFVGLAAWLLYGERPGRAVMLGGPLAFAGMVLVTGLGRPEAYGADPVRGTVLGILTGVTYTAFLLLFRASSRDLPSPIGALFDATLGTAVATGAVGWLSGHLDLAWQWPAHGWLVALALGSQVAGWLLIAHALPRLPAVDTSVLLLLQPMATVLLAYLLFAEDLSSVQWMGVLLVLAGVGLPGLIFPLARSRRPGA